MKSSHWKSSKYDIKKQQASVLADIMNTAVKDKIASSSFEAKQTENSTELREIKEKTTNAPFINRRKLG